MYLLWHLLSSVSRIASRKYDLNVSGNLVFTLVVVTDFPFSVTCSAMSGEIFDCHDLGKIGMHLETRETKC